MYFDMFGMVDQQTYLFRVKIVCGQFVAKLPRTIFTQNMEGHFEKYTALCSVQFLSDIRH